MFADKLKKLRAEKGLKQQQLAEELNVSKSSIAMWETNNREPDAQMLIKIANFSG